ncbi:gamma-glutamylcysteine synthetase [Allocatelliglobosispora scoriae]|uniref:glutamate--cysteine ligase n=1 Tax=Allocatelliglobosispora scoriae TaxID=643052 RepID=A0A841BHU8_9ACTN|nr:glutamate-cysteine ligase family protein [Allocatelliglobosispora scoriae]MBB5867854.1 gamma-glutamylcysteine synthetase [Allocatelliglobosispora scoriae]
MRKIGVELEFPVVQSNGYAVEYSTIRRLFPWLEASGWQISRDEGTGECVEATHSAGRGQGRFGYVRDSISTDVGFCTIEVSLSPEDDLFALARHWDAVRRVLLEFFTGQDCHILGYGVQPLSVPERGLIARKGRYLFLEQDSLNRIVDQRHGADVSVFAISASNQCHIDVYRDEAISAVNLANGLAPIFSAITANAPVWRGGVDPDWVDIREFFWDRGWSNRIDQIGIPDRFTGFDDYVERICAFRPLMVKRDGQYIQITGCRTFADYLARGGDNTGMTVMGEAVPLSCAPEDIQFHGGFAWWQARLAAPYGTIEFRPCSQQPPDATLAVAALGLGVMESLHDAHALYDRFTVTDWRRLRFDVLRHGLKASLRDLPVTALAQQLLDIARAGLISRGLGEEAFLDVLQERVSAGVTVADPVAAAFDPDDLTAFLDLVRIR